MTKLFLLLILLISINAYSREGSQVVTLNRNYFLMGDSNTPVKAEVSIEYSLFNDNRLCFAYHHKTIWGINQGSAPVVDNNYNPQLYYTLGEKIGFEWTLGVIEHLSNGGEGEDSRGVNMSYINFFKKINIGSSKIDIGGKFFVPYRVDNETPDIVDYMGIWTGLVRIHNFVNFLNLDYLIEFRVSPGGRYGAKLDLPT